MLRKMMAMLPSKYLSIKTKMRAIETRLAIHLLLLQDKKIVRHFFHQRRHLNLSNTVEDGDHGSINIGFTAAATTNILGAQQLTEDSLGMKDDDDYELPAVVDKSNNYVVLVDNSFVTSPVSIIQLAEEKMEADEDYEYLPFEDDQMEDKLSVIEMVKNAKERQGKEFKLEDNIDEAADLFIRRFHHQIRLHKFQPEPQISTN